MKTSMGTYRALTGVTSVAVAVGLAVGVGAAPALADEQGGTLPGESAPEQGGTTPPEQGNEQGGTTPTPAPPAPAPAPSQPQYDPGPGIVPSPPSGTWQATPPSPAPQYQQDYTPLPSAPLHAPRPTPPVPRIAPAPQTIRVGNFQTSAQGWNPQVVTSVNEWSAYAESEIARGLISIGVPRDEASRKAAATVIGAAAGGAIGFAVGFTATAVVVGPVAVPLGALIGAGVGAVAGATVPPTPANVGPGALIGAGVGAVGGLAAATAAATAGGVAGAVAGGVIGGVTAYALGAGDPGAHRTRPELPDQRGLDPAPPRRPHTPAVPPTSQGGPNQFEAVLPPQQAAANHLPPVRYTVTHRGDVSVSTQIGGQQLAAGWTAEQAQVPLTALGPLAQHAIAEVTRTATTTLQKAIPGLQVSWPQGRPAPTGAHRAHR